MKTHTTLGIEAIEKAEKVTDCENDFLKIPKEIVYCHHEKWDGSGYPAGLKGEEIPLPARIVALVDVYDALRSKKVYKPAYSHSQVVDMIRNERGYHFSENIVDAFLEIQDKFHEISLSYQDEE